MMMNTNTIASSTSPATSGGGCGGSNSGGGGGGSSGGGGGGVGPCGACKFLRRKCVVGCIFAPYFDSEQGAAHFAAVHKVFGASNVSKLLLHIPVHKRLDAVVTITYEAQSRLRDPIYGCVGHIFNLQQQVVNLQAELSYLHAHLATMEPPPQPSAPPQPQPFHFPPALTIQDLPPAPNVISLLNSPSAPTSFDLSALFEPVHVNPPWAPHPRQHPFSFSTATTTTHAAGLPSTSSGGGDDLHELARELLSSSQTPSSSSALPPHSN